MIVLLNACVVRLRHSWSLWVDSDMTCSVLTVLVDIRSSLHPSVVSLLVRVRLATPSFLDASAAGPCAPDPVDPGLSMHIPYVRPIMLPDGCPLHDLDHLQCIPLRFHILQSDNACSHNALRWSLTHPCMSAIRKWLHTYYINSSHTS